MRTRPKPPPIWDADTERGLAYMAAHEAAGVWRIDSNGQAKRAHISLEDAIERSRPPREHQRPAMKTKTRSHHHA